MPHGIGLYSAHSMTAGGPGFMLPIGGRSSKADNTKQTASEEVAATVTSADTAVAETPVENPVTP